MTKQEEIAEEARRKYDKEWLEAERELSIRGYELAVWLNGYLTENFVSEPSDVPIDECLSETLDILRKFHSQGVVIKVGGDLKAGETYVAVVVEPLIG